MSFINAITNEQLWKDFLNREEGKDIVDNKLIRSLKSIIDKQKYLDYHNVFTNFPLANYVEIPKYNTSKTRKVFVYPWKERVILKAMGYYILSKYNDRFTDNSLAYTWNTGVKNAFSKIEAFKLTKNDTVYKNDFSDYFNKIDINILETKLKQFFDQEDNELIDIILSLLKEENVMIKNKPTPYPNKGVMAGSPISGILANIYMHDVDLYMKKNKYKYLRYADDTIIVGEEALKAFKEQLKSLNITFNPKKEETFTLETGINFLGFTYLNKDILISQEAVDKMKSRMKRRAKWYRKWLEKKHVKPEVATKHYIKGINEKLYTDLASGLNWSKWYLPCITNTESIEYLDKYFVKCIRYLYSGTWTEGKKHYQLSYDDIKELGFISLVNNYYKYKKTT